VVTVPAALPSEKLRVRTVRVDKAAALEATLRDAWQSVGPVLIDVPVGRMPRPVFFPPRRTPTKYQR